MAGNIREFETGLVLQRDGGAIDMSFNIDFTVEDLQEIIAKARDGQGVRMRVGTKLGPLEAKEIAAALDELAAR